MHPNTDRLTSTGCRSEPCLAHYAQGFLIATTANTALNYRIFYTALLIDDNRHYNFSLNTVRVGRIGILY